MKNYLLPVLMVLIGLFTAATLNSCSADRMPFGKDTVITTIGNVQEGQDYSPIEENEIPPDVAEAIPEGTVLVFTHRDSLVDPAESTVPVTWPLEERDWGGIASAGLDVAKVFFPGLVAFEGVVALFSGRKRRIYSKAAKTVVAGAEPRSDGVQPNRFAEVVKLLAQGLGTLDSRPAPVTEVSTSSL
jgi:hypothetical protein